MRVVEIAAETNAMMEAVKRAHAIASVRTILVKIALAVIANAKPKLAKTTLARRASVTLASSSFSDIKRKRLSNNVLDSLTFFFRICITQEYFEFYLLLTLPVPTCNVRER